MKNKDLLNSKKIRVLITVCVGLFFILFRSYFNSFDFNSDLGLFSPYIFYSLISIFLNKKGFLFGILFMSFIDLFFHLEILVFSGSSTAAFGFLFSPIIVLIFGLFGATF